MTDSAGVMELKELSRKGDRHFFDRDTMRFFDSRVMDRTFPVQDGIYFVTSEKQSPEHRRFWTVRFMDNSGRVSTIGEFQGWSNQKSAMRMAEKVSAAARASVQVNLGRRRPVRVRGHRRMRN